MISLMNARLLACDASKVEIALDRGYKLTIFFLDSHLARLLISRPGGPADEPDLVAFAGTRRGQ